MSKHQKQVRIDNCTVLKT